MVNRAIATIIAALSLDAAGGVAFAGVEHLHLTDGLYWSVTTATTVGYGDITPHTTVGHIIAILVMLTVIPLVAATFSLLTSGLTTQHVDKHVSGKLDHIIKHHPRIPEYRDGNMP